MTVRRNVISSDAQRGLTLLLVLLMLSGFSLLVSMAVWSNGWQLRIQANQSTEERALDAAKAAQNWAEAWLTALPGNTPPEPCVHECEPGTGILRPPLPGARPVNRSESWWLVHALADGSTPAASGSLAKPSRFKPAGRWLIEEVHRQPGLTSAGAQTWSVYYRVTSRAARSPIGPAVVIESVFARTWDTNLIPGEDEPATSVDWCGDPLDAPPCGRLAWRRLR